MRHDKHRVLAIRQIILQPSHSLQVQVVGRLVEEQVVGISEKSLCQKHAHLLLTAQILHQHVMLVLLHAQTAKQRARIALGVPSAELREFFLKFGGTDAVGIREVRLGIKSVFLLHYVPKHRMPLKHRVHNRKLVESEVVLAQHRHTLARPLLHRAVRGRQLTRQYAHQRTLSRAVSADYAVAVARRELQVHILKQHTLAELHTQICNCNHTNLF